MISSLIGFEVFVQFDDMETVVDDIFGVQPKRDLSRAQDVSFV